MRRAIVPCIIACTILAACGRNVAPSGPAPRTPTPSTSPSLAREISSDPLTDGAAEHATEVEPSAAAWGSTIVAAFQVGRHSTVGASGIGVAVSHDGGATWSSLLLPAQTIASNPPGSATAVSDPAVAYDAAHARWLVVSLPINGATLLGPYVAGSSDGLQWSAPVQLPAGAALADKPWIACDDGPASRYYGRCYVAWDDGGATGALRVSASDDGGATWSVSRQIGAYGIGAQPLIRADGTIVLMFEDFNEQSVRSASSSDGGASWSAAQTIARITAHFPAGGIRAGFLQSAAMDARGTAYAVWPDCRFRMQCAQNDLVIATSPDGRTWTTAQRVALDSAGSTNDHFITGLAADSSAPGHLALTYYEYTQSNCTAATCQLYAALTASPDGGATWTSPVVLTGPMQLSWLAKTGEGAMVGDYAAALFAGGRAHAIFAAASAPAGSVLAEGTYYSL